MCTAVIGMVIRISILKVALSIGTASFVCTLGITPFLIVLLMVWEVRGLQLLSLLCLAITGFAAVGNYLYFDLLLLSLSTLNASQLVFVTGFELLTLIVLIPFALMGKLQKSALPTS